MIVLVTGGRDYADRDAVFAVLNKIHAAKPIDRVVHGGSTGADSLAHQWAHDTVVDVMVFEADWKRRGPRAGPERNERMVRVSKADLCVAFPGGRGTADCVRRCKKAGIPVYEVSSCNHQSSCS